MQKKQPEAKIIVFADIAPKDDDDHDPKPPTPPKRRRGKITKLDRTSCFQGRSQSLAA